VDCLSVLIKHGASMLIKDTDGLPVAYQILSDPFHPLRKAALQNATKMLSPSMCATLENILQDYFRQHPTLSQEKIHRLREGAAIYRINIEAMSGKAGTTFFKIAHNKKHACPVPTGITESNKMRDTLMSDPEVSEKHQQFQRAATRLFSAQSEKDKRSMLFKGVTPQPSDIAEIEQEGLNRVASLPLATAKKVVLEYFNDYIVMCEAGNTMTDLEKIAQQKGFKHKKAAKKARQEIARLMRQIEPLVSKYESPLPLINEILSSKKCLDFEKRVARAPQCIPPLQETKDTTQDPYEILAREALSQFEKTVKKMDSQPTPPDLGPIIKDLLEDKDFNQFVGEGLELLLPLTEKILRKIRTTPPPSVVATSSNLFPKPGSPPTVASGTPETSIAKPNPKNSRPL